jgi:hypothetical protein
MRSKRHRRFSKSALRIPQSAICIHKSPIFKILPSLRRGRCTVQSNNSPPLFLTKYSPISSKGGLPGSAISTSPTPARRARRTSLFMGCASSSQKQISAQSRASTSWRWLPLSPSYPFFKVEISTWLISACKSR